MQKATSLVLSLIGMILIALMFFIFNPLAFFYFLAGSSCASIGVTHMSERDVRQIATDLEYQNIMTLTDLELKDVPKMREAINKASSKTQYNEDSRTNISQEEKESYYQLLEDRYLQQIGFVPREKQYSFLIEYEGKRYLVGDFPTGEESNPEVYVSKDPMIRSPKITLDNDDLDRMPTVKQAISNIGTYRVSSHESIGVSEADLDWYGEWFFKQYEKQYGNATGKSSSYFKYRNQTYSVTFAIC